MRVGIVGAGAVGRFVAVRLSASGTDVVLVSPHVPPAERLAAVEVSGRRIEPGPGLVCTTDPAALASAEICLVAVKSAATEAVAETLAGVLSPLTPVVSLQNGLGNAARLRERLGDRAVGGVVSYNVFVDGEIARQATAGVLFAGMKPGIAGHRLRQLRAAFRRAGDVLVLREDVERVIAGKLLLNLNNGICAATGLSISESLRQRDARWCFAACLREATEVMQRAGLRPARVTIVPPRIIAALMMLPDRVVLRVARAVIEVDPRARSSTLQDLDRGRRTEIDELNGAIVALAARADTTAPANETITRIVHDHEEKAVAGGTPDFIGARELRARIQAAVEGR